MSNTPTNESQTSRLVMSMYGSMIRPQALLSPGRCVCLCVLLGFIKIVARFLSRGFLRGCQSLQISLRPLHNALQRSAAEKKFQQMSQYSFSIFWSSSSSANESTNYSFDDHGLLPWWFRCLGSFKVRSISSLRVLMNDCKISWVLEFQEYMKSSFTNDQSKATLVCLKKKPEGKRSAPERSRTHQPILHVIVYYNSRFVKIVMQNWLTNYQSSL